MSKRTKPSFSNPSRADGPTCRERREARRKTPGILAFTRNILFVAVMKMVDLHGVLGQDASLSVSLALAGIVTPGNHLIGDGGKAIAQVAVEPGLPSTLFVAGKAVPPPARTCTSTTSTPITAVSSNGSTASTASPPRTCPIISVGGALSKPGATNSNRQAGSKALSETGHTNR